MKFLVSQETEDSLTVSFHSKTWQFQGAFITLLLVALASASDAKAPKKEEVKDLKAEGTGYAGFYGLGHGHGLGGGYYGHGYGKLSATSQGINCNWRITQWNLRAVIIITHFW